ncbi:hypothetical protein NC651_002699 [Populus alba x Populus x berolinensis]|nr:hypothetical protein NC651_002699 [Populus alba x Populus x berolinensis]
MESSQNHDTSWTAATNWTIAGGSLFDSLAFESSLSLITHDDNNDQGQFSTVDSKSKSPLVLYAPAADSAPCEITINFARKHEVRQVYVRSTARVYEIYCAPEQQSSTEYLCTVRCGIVARDEDVLHATNVEEAVLAHASSIQESAEEKLRNGSSLSPNEDDWVEVKALDSPLVINRNSSSSNSDIKPERNSQDFYEATAEITDANPSTSLTLRLLSLQNKVYVFGDPADASNSDNQVGPMENSAGNSLMAMLVPAFFQLSKTKGIGGGEDKCNIDTRERQNSQDNGSKAAAPVDVEKKNSGGSVLDQLVSRTLTVIEDLLFEVPEESMMKPINSIDVRLRGEYDAAATLMRSQRKTESPLHWVKDLEDAVQELWRRRDKADRGLIASLRAAAGLPAQEDIFSITPYSDDDENGPAAPRNDFGRSIKLSLKGLVEKSPKKSKDHGKKHLNKKYPKRKGPHAASFSKTESYQHESHSYEHDSGDEKNNDTESQEKGGLGRCSSPVAGIVSKTEGICSINQPGALKHKFVEEVMVSDGERTSKIVKIKSNKPHDLDSGDDAEKPSKSKSVKAKKLVINLGARKINVSSSPKSDAQSCQREQDLKASNGDGVDHSEQKRGLIKFARREGNFIKFGKVKAEASNLNLKSDGGNHFDAYETTPLDHARVTSSKRSLEGSRAAVGPAGEVPMLRNDRVSLGKQSEARLDTHTESNDDSGDTPILHSLPKDSKLSLKLKIKKPNLENQSSQILLHEEEKSNTRGQRSKRKRASTFMDKTMYNEDEDMSESHLDSEMMEANWILKKLGKDAIGKRVEVHQPSDNSWYLKGASFL